MYEVVDKKLKDTSYEDKEHICIILLMYIWQNFWSLFATFAISKFFTDINLK